jgi:pimeloyl-ACP methyl ester carboxylesterase
MSKTISIFLLLGLLLCFSACEKSEFLNDGEYFFLKNNGAVLPVWIRGNLSSGIILVTVHGGPGGSGHTLLLSEGFRQLEKNYAVLYWDQRYSGLSQGNPDKSTLTIGQFIDDVSKIVQLARSKYPSAKLFMLGHSWGGGLSAAYLGSDDNQSAFSGWIDVDGSVRDDIEEAEIRKWILERVPEHYSDDPPFWQFIIDWYNENPLPVYSDEEPYLYVSALGGDEKNSANYPLARLVFSSPFSLAVYSNHVDQTMADGIDFTPQLNNIHIPSLIIWGKEDGILPLPLSRYAYDQIATDSADKKIITVQGSAHSPQVDNPSEFASSISAFIKRYR